MKIEDHAVDQLSAMDAITSRRVIVELLCGERNPSKFTKPDELRLIEILERASDKGINWAQFNELLLTLDQPRVSEGFFDFFFEGPTIRLDEMKKGIAKFRGFAMLKFGNFRYAFKQLSDKDLSELQTILEPYSLESSELEKKLIDRPTQAIPIHKISKNQTWFVGYISYQQFDKETKHLDALTADETSIPSGFPKKDMASLVGDLERMGEEITSVENAALSNTDIYLTWDYMDVYVATSMRDKWEFEETAEFIENVFSDGKIKKLNLRHFDPTQSQCSNRLDKGLVEGLMLKRASCTIYMAQESDTLGKDSELASTLAQGKPVIAFVPKIDIKSRAKRLEKYPLDFFARRLKILIVDGLFQDDKAITAMEEEDPDPESTINEFLDNYSTYRDSQPFTLWNEKDDHYKGQLQSFTQICQLLAIAEHFSFEKRAKILKKDHPLSIQVHLETGVANGVLVVRSHRECAELLRGVLLNELSFSIEEEEVDEGENGATLLLETVTNCPYRVVTKYEKLVNSFWSHYFTPN